MGAAVPYDDTPPLNVDTKCDVESTFEAEQWKLKDLQASPWAPAIDALLGWHPYVVGSCEGPDPGTDDREFLIVEWTDAPTPVRVWIQNQHVNKGNRNSAWWLFGVLEKQAGGRRCLPRRGLAVGGQKPVKDHSVIAWPIKNRIPDTKHGQKEITFNIRAMYMIETDHGKAWRETWENVHTFRPETGAEADEGGEEKEEGTIAPAWLS